MKTSNYKYLLIFAFACLNVNLKAQTSLSGQIVDKTQAPVPSVSINLGSGFLQTFSDNDGNFSFVYPDTLTDRTIQLEAFGYKKKKVAINKGQRQVRVILLDSVYTIQNVVVSHPKYGKFTDYSAQTIKMSTMDIITNPAAMADMLAGMRGILPGVQTNDNDGRLIIQGGSSDESQVYINDLMVANPYNLSANNTLVRNRFSASSDLFDGVVLQSGGYNAEFGQALSGIVNLNTLDRASIEPKTDIAVSSVYAALTHIDRKPSYAYRTSLNYTNIGPYSRLIPRSYEWNKYYNQLTADFFLTKEFSPKTKMTMQANLSKAGMEYTYDNIDNLRITNGLNQDYLYAQVNLYHALDAKWSLSLASNIVAENFTATQMQLKDEKQSVWNHSKLNLQYSNGKVTNRSGIEWINNPFSETYTAGPDELSLEMNNRLMSLYNDTKLILTNQLTANIGLRGEYSNYLKRFNLAPRLYLGYALNPENIVSVSAGQYFQLPATEYLKWDNRVDFTSVDKATFSYSYVKQSSKFQLDTYCKKYNKVLTWETGTLQPENLSNHGDGTAWGADIFWKSDFKRVEYWLTYSYNHTKKQYGAFLGKVSPDYVVPHAFNASLKYFLTPFKSLLSASYNITSGAPYYSESSPYEQLGVTPFRNRFDFSWSYLPVNWIIINAGCQNILGAENIYGYRYSQAQPGIRQAITNPDKRFFFLGVFITLSHNKKLNQLKNL
ncbi:TonB-dependent receptor [Bacteroidia bacterium]|nr:TonB-dependent receptor [Bacteroidia bacterium]